ncbi:MAG: nuclear transport factor 2 family protein [Pseudomonadota bacterium]
MHPNEELIDKFYRAFQQLDAETMATCYAGDVQFSDPVFSNLQDTEATDMWRMLCSKAQNFSLTYDGVHADDKIGEAHWIATYTFSQTGRTVVNDIRASFIFKNGKIISHRDQFDLWKWAGQALGFKGLVLGWSPLMQNAIRAQAAKGLQIFRSKK